MAQTTQVNPATDKLSVAQAYANHIARVRRQAAIDRHTAESRAETQRVLDLYENGSLKRKQPEPEPAFKPASTYVTTRLPGGAKASLAAEKAAVTRRKRVLDESPEAVAKREKRRARRAARKARQAAVA